MKLWRRLWFLLNRSRVERELADEMAAHRELMGSAAGFGNTLRLREESADAWGWRWLDTLWQDVRHGFRIFRRAKSFALTAVLVVALGTGLNLGMFQLLNLALVAPLKVREPETLVRLYQHNRTHTSSSVAYPVARFIAENNDVLAAVLLTQRLRMAWGADANDQIEATLVSANYFDELGAGAAYGRVFHEGEGDAPGVVVSHEFWQSRLGARPGIVGTVVHLNGRPLTVIGVATAGFKGAANLSRPHVWTLLDQVEHLFPGSPLRNDWANGQIDMYARLQAGVSPAAAGEALRAPMAALGKMRAKELGEEPYLEVAEGGNHFRREKDQREMRLIVGLLAGLGLLVLTVACANLASLMISHISSRQAEFQMRAALGAGTSRVLRQLVTETAVLVLGGVVTGWLLGYGVAQMIATQTDAPFEVPFWPDWRMALGATVLGWISLLLVGVLPAWRAVANRRLSVSRAPRVRLQRGLIGVQVLGSCVLLLVGGVLTRKLQSMVQANFGFDYEKVAVLEASLGRYGIKDDAAAAYWRAVQETAARESSLDGAALSTFAPLGSSLGEAGFADAPGLLATMMTVDEAFLPLMKIPLLTGRNFQPGDTPESAVIISRRLAERMYGSLDVLGKSFPKSGDEKRAAVVGITADANLIKITASNRAEFYRPMSAGDRGHALLLARVKADTLEPLRAAARRVNPAIIPTVRWMKSDLERRLEAPKLTSMVSAGVGLLTMALTAIGIFGLVAYTVSLRTREVGIRLALGAGANHVLWLVLKGLMGPIVLGALLGALVVMFGLAGILRGEPFYAETADPVAIALGLLVLGVSGAAACLAPAARALRISPTEALRQQ